MRVVLQRVSQASVEIEGSITGEIGPGLVILLGIEEGDSDTDIAWLCRKIAAMRIFPDEEGHMNISINDVNGEALVISQFTLHASTKKGNRPSFIKAARPEHATTLYEAFIDQLAEQINGRVATGEFGAYMSVSLVNDGPVTIVMDSKMKE